MPRGLSLDHRVCTQPSWWGVQLDKKTKQKKHQHWNPANWLHPELVFPLTQSRPGMCAQADTGPASDVYEPASFHQVVSQSWTIPTWHLSLFAGVGLSFPSFIPAHWKSFEVSAIPLFFHSCLYSFLFFIKQWTTTWGSRSPLGGGGSASHHNTLPMPFCLGVKLPSWSIPHSSLTIVRDMKSAWGQEEIGKSTH